MALEQGETAAQRILSDGQQGSEQVGVVAGEIRGVRAPASACA